MIHFSILSPHEQYDLVLSSPIKNAKLQSMKCLKHQRMMYLDILRVAAIFLVLLNHSGCFAIPLNMSPEQCTAWFCLFISICIKVAVPIFFMISGALLLTKEESLSILLKKRVLRFFIVILIFHLIQHSYTFFCLGVPVSVKSIIYSIRMGISCPHGSPAVWFLYAYLAFILLLPFLRPMVKEMKNEHFIYLFALQIVLCGFTSFTGISQYLYLCTTSYLYPIAGYFIETRISDKQITRPILLRLACLSFICILLAVMICTASVYTHHSDTYTESNACFQGCLLIPCITLYLIAKRIPARPSGDRFSKWISVLGQATFTVMILENILRDLASQIIPSFSQTIPCIYLHDICVCVLACAIGLTIGAILKRVPGIRSLL